jgi:hypothetical protein
MMTVDYGQNKGFFHVTHTFIEQLSFLPLKARYFDCFFYNKISTVENIGSGNGPGAF